jgi:serine/threonine-protein kinase HipA
MSYVPTNVIEVAAWGRTVGAVALNPDSGWYAFAYTPEWIETGIELAPLHMPLRAEPYEFPELPRATFYGLPALLADALPDAFGNALVDAYMAERGIDQASITPLDRLAYAANRAMGALEFMPPARDLTEDPPTAVALADLVLAARQTVEGMFAGDEAAKAALRQLISVGTSAGGARAKAVVSFNPATSQVRSAYSPASPGFEPWLIKLDGVGGTPLDGHTSRLGESAPYGRIEFAYSNMAKAAGLAMTECLLLAEGPRRHFMTKRFDRGGAGEKHHVISLCALAQLDFNLIGVHSYDQFLQTVTALGLDRDALDQAYRRMVFNVMAVNRDDHTKNQSFRRGDGAHWELAPAYDVTHAYRADSQWTSRHLMSINGKFEGITTADFYAVGERHGVPGYRDIIRDVLAALDQWETYAEAAEIDPQVTKEITADMERFRPSS